MVSRGRRKKHPANAVLAERKGLGCLRIRSGTRGKRFGGHPAQDRGGSAQKRDSHVPAYPYFISLSSVEEEKRQKSVEYIRKSLWAAELLGADTIVIHSGSAGKISREEAMALSCDTLARVIDVLGDEADRTGIRLGIETMGKVNQLGTLEEVIRQCRVDRRFVPVVDFGHMNARVGGGLFPDADSYRAVFTAIGEALGDAVARNLHCHFSKIQFTAAGEKKHLTFADTEYGPTFEPLMEAIVSDGLTPRIICESDGTMPEDALAMKQYYTKLNIQKEGSLQ